MRMWIALGLIALASAVQYGVVHAEFDLCLGIEMSQLQSIANCSLLYAACKAGVAKLNDQLHIHMASLHPVSIVSATELKPLTVNGTRLAMLVQLAPIDKCMTASISPGGTLDARCTFDMARLEIYSILTTNVAPNKWILDVYKKHSLSADERRKIVDEYESGKYYGSNLAIGIFDAPYVPPESIKDSNDRQLTRFSTGIFMAIVLATVALGLVFHQRRRLHNGYAPITISKRGQLQSRNYANTPRPEASGPAIPDSKTAEETSLKQETTTERFAV